MTDLNLDDGPAYAAATGALISALGGGFMISSQAKAFSKDNGLRGREAYVLGRGSVLGDVHADVVTAAFGFWPADVIRTAWDGGRAVMTPAEAVPLYVEACRNWGRVRYASFADTGRLVELLTPVVDGIDVEGLPLFAGWRAIDLPDDDAGRLSQQLHVLREHRGGVHLIAVIASGLTPHQAVLAGPGGPDNATFFGYEEPFEDISRLRGTRHAAEDLTNKLAAPALDALGHDERAETLQLLHAAAEAAFTR
jgi:hypothetical protein